MESTEQVIEHVQTDAAHTVASAVAETLAVTDGMVAAEVGNLAAEVSQVETEVADIGFLFREFQTWQESQMVDLTRQNQELRESLLSMRESQATIQETLITILEGLTRLTVSQHSTPPQSSTANPTTNQQPEMEITEPVDENADAQRVAAPTATQKRRVRLV